MRTITLPVIVVTSPMCVCARGLERLLPLSVSMCVLQTARGRRLLAAWNCFVNIEGKFLRSLSKKISNHPTSSQHLTIAINSLSVHFPCQCLSPAYFFVISLLFFLLNSIFFSTCAIRWDNYMKIIKGGECTEWDREIFVRRSVAMLTTPLTRAKLAIFSQRDVITLPKLVSLKFLV